MKMNEKKLFSRGSRPSPTRPMGVSVLALSALWAAACSNGGQVDASERTSAIVSTAPLQVKELTNSCGANQVQDFFQVTNTGTTPVKLSDIKIKLWADDTSGQALVPHVSTGGCVSGANGNPSCVHQAAGVTASATSFSPACGPDAAHQANWEITLSTTDSATIPSGGTWNNIQAAFNLANFSNFTPGGHNWFSSCLTGSTYVADTHFALYYQGTLVFSNGIGAPSCRGPQGTQVITSYVQPPASPVVGPAPATQVISLAVGLPVSNLSQLQAFANQASDPTNPATYRHYMQPADLIANYAPSTTVYSQLVAWAQGRGFTNVGTFPNRLMISVVGTVAQIEAAFHANVILAKRPDGTQFYRLDRQPSIDLAVPVLGVSGLDNYVVPHHGAGTAPVGGQYSSSDLRTAYLGDAACTGLTGAGQTIGIFSPGYGFDPNDVALYKTRAHITNSPPLRVLSGDDPTNPSPTPRPPTGNWDTVEPSLDPEAATAMAPGAQVIVFEGNNGDTMLELMANTPGMNQISSSWVVGSDILMTTTLAVMAAQGQSFFTASMDFGSYQPVMQPTATCPADGLSAGTIKNLSTDAVNDFRNMPYVTVVGGTDLTTDNTTQAWTGESAWPGSGGGVLPATPIPSYQAGANPGNAEVSTIARNVPDVALIGDNMYIVFTQCTAPGHTGNTGDIDPTTKMPVPATCPAGSLIGGVDGAVGGTSVASPLWAGVMALINQQGKTAGLGLVGFANPTFYQIGKDPMRYPQAFRDVVAGATTNACGFSYTTKAGYDLTTGWGTPRCGLIAAINGAAPTVTIGISGAAQGGPIICTNGKGFTKGGTVTVQYAGVPELVDPSNPTGPVPLDVITTTQVVQADGTFKTVDNEITTVGNAVTTGVAACTQAEINTGIVTVNAIDNTTGIATTATIAAKYFCQKDQSAPFALGGGCEIPPATTPLVISAGGIAPQDAEFGPDVCLSGSGFTPNGPVAVEYFNVPLPGFTPQIVHGKTTADANGKVKYGDFSFSVDGDSAVCTTTQAFTNVVVVLTDETTGNNTSDTLDAALWCSLNYNPPDSGDLSGCGL